MGRVETESARMGRLVDDLLTLARSDEQREFIRRSFDLGSVDLGSVCADAVTDASAIDGGRLITFTDQRNPSVDVARKVAGDSDAMQQVLNNLLMNARRHTPTGTPIEVGLRNNVDFAEVTVVDHGPGFAAEDIAHVFDWFWRASEAKGSGLGLAIVRAIVEAHGGTVTAANANWAGAVLTVRLPLVP